MLQRNVQCDGQMARMPRGGAMPSLASAQPPGSLIRRSVYRREPEPGNIALRREGIPWPGAFGNEEPDREKKIFLERWTDSSTDCKILNSQEEGRDGSQPFFLPFFG